MKELAEMRTVMPFVAAVVTLVAFGSPAAAQPRVAALAIDQRPGDRPFSSGSAASSVSADPGSPIRADETCDGKPAGAACWMQVYQRPGCYVWNAGLVHDYLYRCQRNLVASQSPAG